jgi:hypothetical protein
MIPFIPTRRRIEILLKERGITKENVEQKLKEKVQVLTKEVILTIQTKNPRGININEYIDSYRKPSGEWKWPVTNVEYKQSGEFHLISIRFICDAASPQIIYHAVKHDPVTKKQFPDFVLIGPEIYDKKEVKQNAETR